MFGLDLINQQGQHLFIGEEVAMVLLTRGSKVFSSRSDYIKIGNVPPEGIQVYVYTGESSSLAYNLDVRSDGLYMSIFREWSETDFSVVIHYYVFHPMPDDEPSGYGMSIINSNGNYAYHTGHIPLMPITSKIFEKEGDYISIPSGVSKLAHRIMPPRLESFSGSQASGGYTVNVGHVENSGGKVFLRVKSYFATFPSLGVILGSAGYWDRFPCFLINGEVYD